MDQLPFASTAPPESIDVVGDLHGAYGTLLDLLQMLGYRRVGGRWRHAEERRLLFLGDYVDRGPRSYDVYRLVRALCEDEMAVALLGNHELNAIAFATRRGGDGLDAHGAWNAAMAAIEGRAMPQGGWLRDHRRRPDPDHGLPSNLLHHRTTLLTTTRNRYSEMLDWFIRLPVWLETGTLRAVHAAWIQESIEALRRWAAGMNRREPGITCPTFADAIRECRRRSGILPELKHEIAMELMCDPERGFEHEGRTIAAFLFSLVTGIDVPIDPPVVDAEGAVRQRMRVRWYLPSGGRDWRDYVFMPSAVLGAAIAAGRERPLALLAAQPFAPDLSRGYPPDERPVFFGHFGLRRGDPVAPLAPNVACLDYSGYEDGGELVAYRFDGEAMLSEERMHSVPAREPIHPSHPHVPRDEDPRRDRPWSVYPDGPDDVPERLATFESRLPRTAARQAENLREPGPD